MFGKELVLSADELGIYYISSVDAEFIIYEKNKCLV